MTDASNEITLDEVRVRFMDAEASLTEAASSVGAIKEAADRIGAAREGLGAAGVRLGELAGSLEGVASSLADNATHLREGVDAIKAGDPAEIKRQILELDSAFTAMQSVVGDRLSKIEQQAVSAQQDGALRATAATRENRLLAAGIAILVVASIVVHILV